MRFQVYVPGSNKMPLERFMQPTAIRSLEEEVRNL